MFKVHPQVRAALLEHGERAIAIARRRASQIRMTRTIWSIRDDGAWNGAEIEDVEVMPDIFSAWREPGLVDAIEAAISTHQPELASVYVGCVGEGVGTHDPKRLLNVLVGAGFAVPDAAAAINAMLDELEREVNDGITAEWFVPLEGFGVATSQPIEFPGGVVLRRFELEDANRWYSREESRRDSPFLPGALFVGKSEAFIKVGQFPKELLEKKQPTPLEAVRPVVTALTLHKEGLIHPTTYRRHLRSPFSTGSWSPRGAQIMGSYAIDDRDVEEVLAIATHLSTVKVFPAMQLALDRLVESSARSSPRDAILDAVVGLEALILDGADREGLRFRFAVHAASLLPGDDVEARRKRYREAYALYGIRNKVAHETLRDAKYMVGDESLTPRDVAKRARAMLREAIRIMLRDARDVPPGGTARESFWQSFWLSRIYPKA